MESESSSSEETISIPTAQHFFCTVTWELDDEGTLTFTSGGKFDPTIMNGSLPSWHSSEKIKKIVFTEEVIANKDSSYLFYKLENLSSIEGLEKLDTSQVIDMSYMFYDCMALSSLDLGTNFDTSNVINMKNMFYDCYDLSSLNLDDKFDTSNVIDMKNMFANCFRLTSLDLSDKFNTSSVTNMSGMFTGSNLGTTLNLGDKFDTSNVETMSYMFSTCYELKSLDLGDKFNTSSVTSMYGMFSFATKLESLTLGSNFNFVDGTSAELRDDTDFFLGTQWTNAATGKTFATSEDFMTQYDAATDAGTYTREPIYYEINYHLEEDEKYPYPFEPDKVFYTYIENYGAVLLYEPHKGGYIFEGWFTDPEFTKPVTQIDKSIVPSGRSPRDGIDVYPKFTPEVEADSSTAG